MRKLAMPSLASTLILLLAMSGAAVGAKYIITKPNQIKPSVRKVLEGATGPAGPAGTAGIQGPVGPQGPTGGSGQMGPEGPTGDAGEDGTDGAPGKDGTSVAVEPVGPTKCEELGGAKVTEEKEGGAVVEVCNGKPGAKGEKGDKGDKGEPWTPNGTLPVGATLTGTWSASATTTGKVWEPISFPIKLVAPLVPANVHFSTEANFKDFDGVGPETVGCKNSVANPTAPSGHLCVYKSTIEEPEGGGALTFTEIRESSATGPGAGRAGAQLFFEASAAGVVRGAWAIMG